MESIAAGETGAGSDTRHCDNGQPNGTRGGMHHNHTHGGATGQDAPPTSVSSSFSYTVPPSPLAPSPLAPFPSILAVAIPPLDSLPTRLNQMDAQPVMKTPPSAEQKPISPPHSYVDDASNDSILTERSTDSRTELDLTRSSASFNEDPSSSTKHDTITEERKESQPSNDPPPSCASDTIDFEFDDSILDLSDTLNIEERTTTTGRNNDQSALPSPDIASQLNSTSDSRSEAPTQTHPQPHSQPSSTLASTHALLTLTRDQNGAHKQQANQTSERNETQTSISEPLKEEGSNTTTIDATHSDFQADVPGQNRVLAPTQPTSYETTHSNELLPPVARVSPAQPVDASFIDSFSSVSLSPPVDPSTPGYALARTMAQELLSAQATQFSHHLMERELYARDALTTVALEYEERIALLKSENQRLTESLERSLNEQRSFESSRLESEYQQARALNDGHMEYLSGLIDDQRARIHQLELDSSATQASHESALHESRVEVGTLRSRISELESLLRVRDGSNVELNSTLVTFTHQCSEFRTIVSEKDEQIRKLELQIRILHQKLYQMDIIERKQYTPKQMLKTLMAPSNHNDNIDSYTIAPNTFATATTAAVAPRNAFQPSHSSSSLSSSPVSSSSFSSSLQDDLSRLKLNLESLTRHSEESIRHANQYWKQQVDQLHERIKRDKDAHRQSESDASELMNLRLSSFTTRLNTFETTSHEFHRLYEEQRSEWYLHRQLLERRLKAQGLSHRSSLKYETKLMTLTQQRLELTEQRMVQLINMNQIMIKHVPIEIMDIIHDTIQSGEANESSSSSSHLSKDVDDLHSTRLELHGSSRDSNRILQGMLELSNQQLSTLQTQRADDDDELSLAFELIDRQTQLLTHTFTRLEQCEKMSYEHVRMKSQIDSIITRTTRIEEDKKLHSTSLPLPSSPDRILHDSSSQPSSASLLFESQSLTREIEHTQRWLASMATLESENASLRQKLVALEAFTKELVRQSNITNATSTTAGSDIPTLMNAEKLLTYADENERLHGVIRDLRAELRSLESTASTTRATLLRDSGISLADEEEKSRLAQRRNQIELQHLNEQLTTTRAEVTLLRKLLSTDGVSKAEMDRSSKNSNERIVSLTHAQTWQRDIRQTVDEHDANNTASASTHSPQLLPLLRHRLAVANAHIRTFGDGHTDIVAGQQQKPYAHETLPDPTAFVERELVELRESLALVRSNHLIDVTRHNSEIKRADQRHDEIIKEIHEKHTQHLNRIIDQHQHDLNQLHSKLTASTHTIASSTAAAAAMQMQLKQEVDAAASAHQRELEELVSLKSHEFDALRTSHAALLASARDDLAACRAECEAQKDQLRYAHETIDRLEKQIEDINSFNEEMKRQQQRDTSATLDQVEVPPSTNDATPVAAETSKTTSVVTHEIGTQSSSDLDATPPTVAPSVTLSSTPAPSDCLPSSRTDPLDPDPTSSVSLSDLVARIHDLSIRFDTFSSTTMMTTTTTGDDDHASNAHALTQQQQQHEYFEIMRRIYSTEMEVIRQAHEKSIKELQSTLELQRMTYQQQVDRQTKLIAEFDHREEEGHNHVSSDPSSSDSPALAPFVSPSVVADLLGSSSTVFDSARWPTLAYLYGATLDDECHIAHAAVHKDLNGFIQHIFKKLSGATQHDQQRYDEAGELIEQLRTSSESHSQKVVEIELKYASLRHDYASTLSELSSIRVTSSEPRDSTLHTSIGLLEQQLRLRTDEIATLRIQMQQQQQQPSDSFCSTCATLLLPRKDHSELSIGIISLPDEGRVEESIPAVSASDQNDDVTPASPIQTSVESAVVNSTPITHVAGGDASTGPSSSVSFDVDLDVRLTRMHVEVDHLRYERDVAYAKQRELELEIENHLKPRLEELQSILHIVKMEPSKVTNNNHHVTKVDQQDRDHSSIESNRDRSIHSPHRTSEVDSYNVGVGVGVGASFHDESSHHSIRRHSIDESHIDHDRFSPTMRQRFPTNTMQPMTTANEHRNRTPRRQPDTSLDADLSPSAASALSTPLALNLTVARVEPAAALAALIKLEAAARQHTPMAMAMAMPHVRQVDYQPIISPRRVTHTNRFDSNLHPPDESEPTSGGEGQPNIIDRMRSGIDSSQRRTMTDAMIHTPIRMQSIDSSSRPLSLTANPVSSSPSVSHIRSLPTYHPGHRTRDGAHMHEPISSLLGPDLPTPSRSRAAAARRRNN